MKTVTVYELLGMVKDGKAPKKIKYKGTIWHLEQDFSNRLPYYKNGYNNDNLLTGKEKDYFSHSLNDEVEILEETKKITPTDFENLGYAFGSIQKYISKGYNKAIEEKKIPEKMEDIENGDFLEIPSNHEIMNKINEIIDYLKSKGE